MDEITRQLRNGLARALYALPDSTPQALALLERLAACPEVTAVVAAVPFICPSRADRPIAIQRSQATTRAGLRMIAARPFTRPAPPLGVPPRVKAAAERAIARLMATMRPADVPKLDDAVRRLGRDAWLIVDSGRWTWVTLPAPGDIDEGPARVALLGLLASHADGHVREAAITELAASPDVAALPFLLWRCGDWVAPVRDCAQRAVQTRLHLDHAPSFADLLPLLERLELIRRVDTSALIADIRALLLREPGQTSLAACLQSPEPRVAREACRTLDGAGVPGPEMMDLALASRDLVVRRRVLAWEARLRASDPQRAAALRVRLAADPASRIRGAALCAMAELDDAAAAERLQAALLDPAASVRHDARFFVGKRTPGTDFAAGYRAALGGAQRAAAIAGLGETGVPADWTLALPLLGGKPREARAALKAAARLDADACHAVLLAALADAREGVGHAALLQLPRRLPEQDSAPLRRLWGEAASPAARRTLAEALLRLPPWPGLLALVSCARTDPEAPRGAAADALARWQPEQRAYYAPEPAPPELRDRIAAALRDAKAALPEETAMRIARLLASVR